MMTMLIPIDGSELSLDAARHALSLRAQGLQCEFVLANVQEPASLYEMITVRDADRIAEMAGSAGAHQLERARDLCNAAGATYRCVVATGEAAHVLLDICEEQHCDAIVIGARGHGGLMGPMLGSVSQELVHTATVPVIVVKHASDEGAERIAASDSDAAAPGGTDVVVGLA